MSDIVTDHQPMEAVHIDDRPWETLRWLGQWSKMLFYPDPHWEAPLSTSTGGLMLFVQYQGPTTGGRPSAGYFESALVWRYLREEPRLGRRTARTFPLPPPPQKN